MDTISYQLEPLDRFLVIQTSTRKHRDLTLPIICCASTQTSDKSRRKTKPQFCFCENGVGAVKSIIYALENQI